MYHLDSKIFYLGTPRTSSRSTKAVLRLLNFRDFSIIDPEADRRRTIIPHPPFSLLEPFKQAKFTFITTLRNPVDVIASMYSVRSDRDIDFINFIKKKNYWGNQVVKEEVFNNFKTIIPYKEYCDGFYLFSFKPSNIRFFVGASSPNNFYPEDEPTKGFNPNKDKSFITKDAIALIEDMFPEDMAFYYDFEKNIKSYKVKPPLNSDYIKDIERYEKNKKEWENSLFDTAGNLIKRKLVIPKPDHWPKERF